MLKLMVMTDVMFIAMMIVYKIIGINNLNGLIIAGFMAIIFEIAWCTEYIVDRINKKE